MRIKDKNIIGMAVAFALAALMLLWGYTAGADDKGINFTFEIDMNATNSGATTAQANRTLRDFKDAYSGTSKIVTLVLKHTGSGVTKACVVGTALTLGSNIYLDIRPGAQFTLNANLTVASPGHILAACDQLIKGGGTGSLLFTNDHLKCPAWDNSGSTTLEMPSAKINNLTGTTITIDSYALDKTEWAALDNINAAWQDWTPSWTNLTVGNGYVYAKYKQYGKLVVGIVALRFGSGTTITGSVAVSLPVTARAMTYPTVGTSIAAGIGTCKLLAGGTFYVGELAYTTTTTATFTTYQVSGTYEFRNDLSATVPGVWVTNDEIIAFFYYEGA